MVDPIQIRPTATTFPESPVRERSVPPTQGFASVLGQELRQTQGVRFSAHALERLEHRGLSLSETEHQKIADAIEQIAEKGGRESVLVLDRAALVVSIPNRTVITVLSRDELQNNVFTNIDSVVIVSPLSGAQSEQEGTGPAPIRGGLHAADRLMRHIA